MLILRDEEVREVSIENAAESWIGTYDEVLVVSFVGRLELVNADASDAE